MSQFRKAGRSVTDAEYVRNFQDALIGLYPTGRGLIDVRGGTPRFLNGRDVVCKLGEDQVSIVYLDQTIFSIKRSMLPILFEMAEGVPFLNTAGLRTCQQILAAADRRPTAESVSRDPYSLNP